MTTQRSAAVTAVAALEAGTVSAVAVQGPHRRWDAALVQQAIHGAVLLNVRDAEVVRHLTEHALGRGAPRLSGRTALALTDLIYGAQRRQRRRYTPDTRTRGAIARALTHAAAHRERRWTAYECWQICRLLPQVHPAVSNKDFTHVAQHTVWAERTQRGQGTLAWEAVFTDCKTFVSRMHGLQRSRAPRGVVFAFCSAASKLPGFFDDVQPRDTLTLLNLLIQCTGLDDLVTVRPPAMSARLAAVRHVPLTPGPLPCHRPRCFCLFNSPSPSAAGDCRRGEHGSRALRVRRALRYGATRVADAPSSFVSPSTAQTLTRRAR